MYDRLVWFTSAPKVHASGVRCHVGGAWVNVDDMVLLAYKVTALQTLLEVCRSYAGPHSIVYNKKVVALWPVEHASQARDMDSDPV